MSRAAGSRTDVICGRIAQVDRQGLGYRAGMRSGDCLLAINGRSVRDVIDVQFLAADDSVEFTYARGDRIKRRRVSREFDDGLGIEFDDPLFDGIRECDNHCPFCFVRQLPDGLRRSLYVQDDDYRLSFLHGSFVTLTNLTPGDWTRLAEQRLSPLYVSVHATQPEIRERVLGRRGAEPVLSQLRRLIELGIVVHTQVVVSPGLNDGDALTETVQQLVALYPGVASVGVVPVGLTRFCRGRLRRNTATEAGVMLSLLDGWHREGREDHGVGLVYAADEWYLLAGQGLPADAYYDEYPQIENGIGLTRQLLDDWDAIKPSVTRAQGTRAPALCISGTLIGPVLERLLADFSARSGIPVELIRVENRFFGETVTVSGLLAAGDVIETLARRRGPRKVLFLPRSMFDDAQMLTLDGWTIPQIADAVGCPVNVVDCLSDLVSRLR